MNISAFFHYGFSLVHFIYISASLPCCWVGKTILYHRESVFLRIYFFISFTILEPLTLLINSFFAYLDIFVSSVNMDNIHASYCGWMTPGSNHGGLSGLLVVLDIRFLHSESHRPGHRHFLPSPSTFGNVAHTRPSSTNIPNTAGMSTQKPLACAIAPTANGGTQAPDAPNAIANPMLETCRCGGKRRAAATTAAGNKGPRKKPSIATKVADARNEGMSQKRRCERVAREM